jgi:hypothetical protein
MPAADDLTAEEAGLLGLAALEKAFGPVDVISEEAAEGAAEGEG